MARPRARVWAPWLAVPLLAACTFGSGSQPAASGPDTAAASPGASAGVSPALPSGPATESGGPSSRASSGAGSPSVSRSSRLLHVATSARIPLAGQTYGRGLVLFGRYAAWVGCNGCQRTFTEPTTLYVADLTTHRVRAVAGAPRYGSLIPVGGYGSRTLYFEEVAADRTLQWTLYALDLVAGSRTVLAKGTQSARAVPPAAVVGDGQVAWQVFADDPEATAHGPVTAMDLRTGARRVTARDLTGVVEGVTRAGLVFRAPTGAGGPLDEAPRDAYVLAPGGGPPSVLSGTHDVRDVVADDATVAWQTDDGPSAAVWAAPLEGSGSPRRFYTGSTGDRAVGTGFLALVTAGDDPVLLLYPLAGGPVVAVGDVPGEFDSIAADGPRLAYLALTGRRSR